MLPRIYIITTLIISMLRIGCTNFSSNSQQPPSAPDLQSYPFAYLRDGRPLNPQEDVVSVIAVGDVLLGRAVADEADPLGYSAPWLGDADITIGNLEGVLIDQNRPAGVPLEGSGRIILD